MPTLYLIRGLPGSGKTTLAKLFIKGVNDTLGMNEMAGPFAADDYFTDLDGSYHYQPLLIGLAHEMCQANTRNAMDGKRDVIVTNTFTRSKELQPYWDMAQTKGYQVTEITVRAVLSDSELAARNVHKVPEETIARMRARWEN